VLTEPVPASVRRHLMAEGLTLRDSRTPPYRVHWTPDHRALLAGGDQDVQAAKTREATLVQRTGQLMYELLKMYPEISGLQPEYGWDATYGVPVDGLMYVGAHRNYPRHLFALGGDGSTVTGAFLAARILARAVQESPQKGDEVFGWTR
jgi:glycine/D-amino acid oxidase-like deaminating enzyme